MAERERRNAGGITIRRMFDALLRAYGPQSWWPGETPLEIMVGAVLTQNTAWTNVEKAIDSLKAAGALSLAALRDLSPSRLAGLIRSSGYHRVKADRLKQLAAYLDARHGGSIARMGRAGTDVLRGELLGIRGVGPETADAILLYALGRPVFVVDAYTRRIALRHRIVRGRPSYDALQRLFMASLGSDARIFNEYHALIVKTGKLHCRKREPRCGGCPLAPFLGGRRPAQIPDYRM